MAADDKPEADVAEQAEAPTGETAGAAPEVPVIGDDRPEADVLEQSIVVEEEQEQSPMESDTAASEGDRLEQSIGVPSDDDDRR